MDDNIKRQRSSGRGAKRVLALIAACAIGGAAIAALIAAVAGAPLKIILGLVFFVMAVPFVIYVFRWITGLIIKGRNKEQ